MQESHSRKLTILIVEDYADSREMFRFLLEGLNYRVVVAEDGHQAFALAAAEEPDLILTDFNLPDINGAELVSQVRKLGKKLSYVPIIMLTALDRDEYYDSAVAAGCTAFLTKPIQFAALVDLIDKLLRESNEDNKDRSEPIHSNGEID
jgi:CheY-like chemotaxis protein